MNAGILNSIHSPTDLKRLSIEQLEQLAAEIRVFLLDNVSKSGGHLSSNLGSVELILALHYVFDSPNDQIIFDVGHQAYTHKIITGRREKFTSLRKIDGLSGFLKRNESEHDIYGAGHASTAVSAAFGFAYAKSLFGNSSHTIAVVGDGALGGGLSFEALNLLGERSEKVLVIVNDNSMSISENVGALSKTLNQLRTSRGYTEFKGRLHRFLPQRAVRSLKNIKTRVRHLLQPATFFESMGMRYYGPIDGHDLAGLIDNLRALRDIEGPVVLHVHTQKGRGYEKAVDRPDTYHGVGSFCPEEGLCSPSKQDFSSVMGEKLYQMAKKDSRIVAVTAAMSQGTGLEVFERNLPEQFLDVGIAEANALNVAAGMSLQGVKPFVAIYSTFLQRAYDIILHDIALQGCPVVICVDRSGLVGADGETHQGIYDVAFLSSIPGLRIWAPKDKPELERMLEAARDMDEPVAIRYPKDTAWTMNQDQSDLNRIEMIEQKGSDHLALSYGRTLKHICEAVEKYDLHVDVANLRQLMPLNFKELEELFLRYRRVCFFEEVVFNGSTAQKLKAAFSNIEVKTLPDSFIEQGTVAELLRKYGLDVEGIAHVLRENKS